MSRRTRRRSSRRPLLVLTTLLLIAGAFLLWTRSEDTAPAAAGTAAAAPTSVSAPEGSEPSATAPPADDGEAADSGDEATETPSQPEPTAAPEPEEAGDEPAAVAVSLTYTGYDAEAAAVVAGGYAADVAEVDATCTLILRRDGVELRGEALGTPSASTTDCGEVRVGGDALTSGAWEAVLSYTSERSAGESSAVEVLVP